RQFGSGQLSTALPEIPPLTALLRRPSDRAIGRPFGWSVHELVAASVEMARHCALGGLPAVFFVEQRNQFAHTSMWMAPEYRGNHIDACESALLARSTRAGSYPCLVAANLSIAP